MPRLPHLSGGEVQRLLEQVGFRKIRQHGSHVIMRRGDRGCVIPMHDEIRVGTLANLLRQAGVTAEEFLDLLGR